MRELLSTCSNIGKKSEHRSMCLSLSIICIYLIFTENIIKSVIKGKFSISLSSATVWNSLDKELFKGLISSRRNLGEKEFKHLEETEKFILETRH